jgi:hypothetical protein
MSVLVELLVMTVLVAENESADMLFDQPTVPSHNVLAHHLGLNNTATSFNALFSLSSL